MPSDEIRGMLTPTGRLKYADLQKYAASQPMAEFTSNFLWPLLVGAALHQGAMEEVGKNMTMSFNLADLDEAAHGERPDPSGLKRAIYPLIKRPDTLTKPDVFAVGREDTNDLVMADYTISRHHAEIRVIQSRLHIVDLHSRNGTMWNDVRLMPDIPQAFDVGHTLAFGRFKFVVVSGASLCLQLRSPQKIETIK